MTRKRCLAVAGILAMLLGSGFSVAMFLLADNGPGVTKPNMDRIEVATNAKPQAAPSYLLDRDAKRVVRHDAKKNGVWSRDFQDDIGGVRPPNIVWDDKRVYFTHAYGVMALDAENGKTLWKTIGPVYGLLLCDGLLLGTGYTPTVPATIYSCWLFACDSAKGTIVFKTLLPREFTDPQAVHVVAGYFVVQTGEAPGGQGGTLLFDKKGDIRHRLNRQVVDGKRFDDDVVLLTSKDVVRVSANDRPAWSIPFERHQWISGGGLVDLLDGDMIAFRHGRISDSGVELIRFTPAGKEKWKAYCPGLRVGLSKVLPYSFRSVRGGQTSSDE